MWSTRWGGALRLGATGVLAYWRLSICRRPLDQPQGASRYCFALFGRVALAVPLKFNPPSPTLPFLVADEIEATVILYVKGKHPDFISGGFQRGRQGGVESYGTAGPFPHFVLYFLIATAVNGR